MTSAIEPVRPLSRAGGGGSYGDYPYGLEPLILPVAGTAPGRGPERGTDGGDGPEWGPAITDEGDAYDLVRYEDRSQLFWFRWITGHQVSFVVWQLLARTAREATGDGQADQHLLWRLTTYVRAYAAMLLYTSSCNREIYESVIRPCMYRHHRWFSGTWAPDYGPVRGLLHGRRLPPLSEPARVALVQEIQLATLVHEAVSRKLVPDGASFVTYAVSANELQRASAPGLMYDGFFLTFRGKVTESEVVAQLSRRVHAVLAELAVNGLYPSGASSAGEFPLSLWTEEINELAGCLPQILRELLVVARGED